MVDNNKKKETKNIKAVKPLVLTLICIALITLITCFAFSPSLDNGFTNWDDQIYVLNNHLVANNSIDIKSIFETPVSSHYHPFTVLSLALNYQYGKLNPYGYHLVNLIFHVLNTILVFLFIFLLTRRNLLMAAIVSLFFGIHPMHVESVSWIRERKDVLYVFFFLSGLITYLRYTETKKRGWYVVTFLLFILSCLSKEMAVVFPVILLLIDYLKNVKWERRLFIEKIPFLLIAIILTFIEIKIQSVNVGSELKTYTAFQRLLFASYSAVMYILRLLLPHKLSSFYPYPDISLNRSIPLLFYLSPVILLAMLSSLIYFFLKKEKEIVFGLLFYLVSIVLVVQFIPINPGITPDRYSYLSYIGLLYIAAYLINKAWQNKDGILASMKYPFIIIAVIGGVVFSFRTYSRTQVWKNSETLWSDVIANYPNAAMAYYGLGHYYDDMREPEKALQFYNKAIETDPTLADAYSNRGVLYMNYGKNDLALADFNKVIELDSTRADIFGNRGVLYMNYAKNDSALADFNKSIELNPVYTRAYTNRGWLYFTQGNINLARNDYTEAIALDSTNAEAYNDRAVLYARYGKNDLALADYSKAILLNPTYAPYYYNRGLCYKDLYQFNNAIDDFIKGIQLNPNHVDFYYNVIGLCCINLQNYNEAMANFSKAITLNPSIAGYWFNRSLAENKAGQIENAKADELKGQQLQGK